MEEIILVGYEIIVEIILTIFVMTIYASINKKKVVKGSGRHILYLAAFAVYILDVLHFTGTGTMFEADLYGAKFSGDQMNFIPLGFFLPFIWCDYKSIKNTVAFGILCSLLIEMSQLLNNRRTDIDDLLLNTVGTFLGFLIFMACCNIRFMPASESDKTEAIIWFLN